MELVTATIPEELYTLRTGFACIRQSSSFEVLSHDDAFLYIACKCEPSKMIVFVRVSIYESSPCSTLYRETPWSRCCENGRRTAFRHCENTPYCNSPLSTNCNCVGQKAPSPRGRWIGIT